MSQKDVEPAYQPGSVAKLPPDRLIELWRSVERGQLSEVEFAWAEASMLHEYRNIWERALLLEGQPRLEDSLLAELCLYFEKEDLTEIRRRCVEAVVSLRDQWQQEVVAGEPSSVESFYDKSEAYIYDLMWWHTLRDDSTPLVYVLALDFAKRHGAQDCLDFGSGVGSGPILFARHGMNVAMADVSSSLLDFSEWRFRLRKLPARIFDSKVDELPSNSFDAITSMGTFEHLLDPADAVERLWDSLKLGGFLVGQFHLKPETDPNHPQHVVEDFAPMFKRMKDLGFVEVWRDNWFWGLVALQKS
jgi:2-polyprenyl-3-methyl-5-hydroxy-6-metoxy-1,4-benzoquinol methylase